MARVYVLETIGSLPKKTDTLTQGLSIIIFHCELCGVEVSRPFQQSKRKKYRFCGTSCSAKWRMQQPEIRSKIYTDAIGAKIAASKTGKKNPWLSEYRKTHNPM